MSIQVIEAGSTVETPSPIESSSDNHKLKSGAHFSTNQNSLLASRLPGKASVSLLQMPTTLQKPLLEESKIEDERPNSAKALTGIDRIRMQATN